MAEGGVLPTYPRGRANRFWFEEGIIVPVEEADEADEAEEESSSTSNSVKPSASSSASLNIGGSIG